MLNEEVRYPQGLNKLLQEANKIAKKIENELNSPNCQKVNELYEIIKSKASRNKNSLDELGYEANIYSGRSKSNENKNNEFKGLYIFGEEKEGVVTPFYIGISRTVFRRLRQHGWGKKHNECSLAYLMTKKHVADIDRTTVTNDDLLPAKEIVQNSRVVLIPVKEDYDLYFLEVAIAGILKTKWNSFRTH